jgi:hypothetical protein
MEFWRDDEIVSPEITREEASGRFFCNRRGLFFFANYPERRVTK